MEYETTDLTADELRLCAEWQAYAKGRSEEHACYLPMSYGDFKEVYDIFIDLGEIEKALVLRGMVYQFVMGGQLFRNKEFRFAM